MKFKLALDKRGLTREDLPKSQQKKIQEIEKLKKQIDEVESEGIDDSVREEFDNIISQFEQADDELVEYIDSFDVEKSKKQREQLAAMREKKAAKNGNSAPEPKPEPIPEPEKVEESQVVTAATTQGKVFEMPQQPSQEEVAQKLEVLKQEAEVHPEDFEIDPEDVEQSDLEPEEVEATEEFEKVSNSTPRKLNIPLIAMGVGALILTWGAVNMFKERK